MNEHKPPHKKSTALILVQQTQDARTLSHAERIYKFRMQRLEQIKEDIHKAKQQIETARHKVRKSIMPIIDRIAIQKFEFVQLLDKAYEEEFFTFRQKEKIRELIEERSHQLLYQYRFEPARKIYKKYVVHNRNKQGGIFDNVNEAAYDFAQAINDMLFGEDKGQHFKIHDEIDSKRGRKIDFHAEQKIPKALDTAQFVRTLYTKLAKELHPDLETDEAKKTEKNEVMRRLTTAYKQQDIYEILSIQTVYGKEIKTQDLADEQIKVLNETLLGQIKKLQQDYKDMTLVGEDAVLYRQFGGNEKVMETKIARHKEELVMELLSLKDELQIVLDKENIEQYLNKSSRQDADYLRW